MIRKAKKSKIAEALKVLSSGFLGVVVTIAYQHFFNSPQSFTFLYNGNEIMVTETEYVELVEQNATLQEQLQTAQSKLSSLQTEVENQKSNAAIEQLLRQATDYWNNADYVQALTVLKNTSVQSEDIQLLYSNYSTEYTVTVLAQADSMIAEKRYDEAVSLLTAGQNIVSDPTEIQKKISQIRDNSPAKLSKLKITSSRFFDIQDSKSLVDTVGNSYPSGNLFTTYAEGDSNYGYASFYLGKKYSGITGTIAVSDESEDVGLEGWVEIYTITGEDYTRLYQSPMLNRMSTPISLPDLNISNADWIEIRYYNKENYYSLADRYHSLQIIISDVTLYSL